MLGPKLVELIHHPNIELFAYTEVLGVEGEPGHFFLTVNKKARAVDPEKCVNCGMCAEKCPVKIPDSFNSGLNTRKAIYIANPQAVPPVYTIDKQFCRYFTKGKCRLCEKFCPTGAVQFDQQDEHIQLETGAIILSGGFEPFDASLKPEYGYGQWPNVLTSLEYERILSATGPTGGKIQRPSDKEEPQRVAWIQCVGSRDSHIGQDYCSSVCCMYAIKQAMMTNEHNSQAETTIFYNDIRAHGKGFDRFYERSITENSVRFIKSIVSRVVPNPEDNTLQLTYASLDHHIVEETFDLVVLSVGICPNPSAKNLARKIGLKLNDFGFCATDPLERVASSRPGIFICGVSQGPRDIPDSVQLGSSASAKAMLMLSDVRNTMVQEPVHFDERDVKDEDPRLGIFVCHCGVNIAGVVDVKAVAEYAKSLPNVIYAEDCMFACSTDRLKEIKKAIAEHQLNRVVVASCSPRSHEPLFRNTLRQAGLNPFLFELANIREHDSWVHKSDPNAATQKAKDLVRMSVSRARLLKPLHDITYDVVQKALVIGGGLAGLTAALSIAKQGYKTVLVEKTGELGGNAKTLYYTEDGANPAKYVEDLIQHVKKEQRITVYLESEVIETKGACGDFTSTIMTRDQSVTIPHGVAIVATGGEEYTPNEYEYGNHPRIVTQKEFESILAKNPEDTKNWNHIVMIQCVGSREPESLYCSRLCCTAAVKNSLKLKSLNPESQISILYRDIRTIGLREIYYQKARKQCVRFFQYKREVKPEVSIIDENLHISVFDQQLQEAVHLNADLIVLSAAIRPESHGKTMAKNLRLPLDQDGFFMEAHPKLRPLDFSKAGFYVCGLAQGPKFAFESIAQARGAVSRAMTVLSRKNLTADGMINHVDRDLCRGCGECEKTCLFEAIKVQEDENGRKTAAVFENVCTGCGACNVACPTGAASLAHFRDDQINATINAFKL
jgi:heterodisulfide reductase subunit A